MKKRLLALVLFSHFLGCNYSTSSEQNFIYIYSWKNILNHYKFWILLYKNE